MSPTSPGGSGQSTGMGIKGEDSDHRERWNSRGKFPNLQLCFVSCLFHPQTLALELFSWWNFTYFVMCNLGWRGRVLYEEATNVIPSFLTIGDITKKKAENWQVGSPCNIPDWLNSFSLQAPAGECLSWGWCRLWSTVGYSTQHFSSKVNGIWQPIYCPNGVAEVQV